jgi:hypothetical protein
MEKMMMKIRKFGLIITIGWIAILVIGLRTPAADDTFNVAGNLEWSLSAVNQVNTLIQFDGINELDNSLCLSLNPQFVDENSKFYAELRLQKSLIANSDPAWYIDEAYYNWDINDSTYFSLGKRRFSYGYSYFWSPSFIINTKKSIFEPERFSEGIPIGLLGFTNGSVSPKLFWTLGDTHTEDEVTFEDSYLGFQTDFYLPEAEFYLNGLISKSKEQMVGLGIRKGMAGFTFQIEGSVFRNSLRKYFDDPTAPGFVDGSPISDLRGRDWNSNLSFGLNRQLFGDGIFIMEYYYNTMGYTKDEFQAFTNALKYFQNKAADEGAPLYNYYCDSLGELMTCYNPGFMQRKYLYLSYSDRLKNNWEWGVRVLNSLDDGSGLIYPSVEWAPSASYRIGLDLSFPFYWKEDSEFGIFPLRSSICLRVKKFF